MTDSSRFLEGTSDSAGPGGHSRAAAPVPTFRCARRSRSFGSGCTRRCRRWLLNSGVTRHPELGWLEGLQAHGEGVKSDALLNVATDVIRHLVDFLDGHFDPAEADGGGQGLEFLAEIGILQVGAAVA